MNDELPPAVPATRDRRGRPSRAGIYKQLAEALAQLQRIGGLPTPLEAEDIWGDIWYAEAHNSTAIEGNTLLLKEVEILLRDGRAVGNKELGDYLEVQGYAVAARWVYNQALAPDWTTGALLNMSEVRHTYNTPSFLHSNTAVYAQSGTFHRDFRRNPLLRRAHL
jgi:hypothetical protein